MEKEQTNENANIKKEEHETLEISSTGYGLESVSKENEEDYKLQQKK